jgi:hypothetical protein
LAAKWYHPNVLAETIRLGGASGPVLSLILDKDPAIGVKQVKAAGNEVKGGATKGMKGNWLAGQAIIIAVVLACTFCNP